MDGVTITTILVSLGVGGVMGALASVLASSARLQSAYQSFRRVFQRYFAGKTDPASLEVVASFEALTAEIEAVSASWSRLKRALKWKGPR
jgi:hypothetical protein